MDNLIIASQVYQFPLNADKSIEEIRYQSYMNLGCKIVDKRKDAYFGIREKLRQTIQFNTAGFVFQGFAIREDNSTINVKHFLAYPEATFLSCDEARYYESNRTKPGFNVPNNNLLNIKNIETFHNNSNNTISNFAVLPKTGTTSIPIITLTWI